MTHTVSYSTTCHEPAVLHFIWDSYIVWAKIPTYSYVIIGNCTIKQCSRCSLIFQCKCKFFHYVINIGSSQSGCILHVVVINQGLAYYYFITFIGSSGLICLNLIAIFSPLSVRNHLWVVVFLVPVILVFKSYIFFIPRFWFWWLLGLTSDYLDILIGVRISLH